MIDRDAEDLSEVIQGIEEKNVDLMLQTSGGEVSAVEKYVTVLQQHMRDGYRVIVPNLAKSGGTIISLAAEKILLGVNSELGPIDPQMFVPIDLQSGPFPYYVACEIASRDEELSASIKETAKNAVKGANALAVKYLSQNRLKGKKEEEVEKIKEEIRKVVKKISSPSSFVSHGSVIDFSEAKKLGLPVEWIDSESDLWKRIWLLYCMYDFDVELREIDTIQEGARYSIIRKN